MNLFFTNVGGHPQEVMKRLGITYEIATPQSLVDRWWFWGCRNVPDELPDWLTVLPLSPREAVGHGLSMADALRLEAMMPSASHDQEEPTDGN
jgi:hypothetical protein